MRRLSIAIDCDGCLRNFTASALVVVKEVTGRSYSPADVTAFNFTKALDLTDSETHDVMTTISGRRGFVTSMPSYPEARQGVRRLRELGDVFCVTTPWETPWGTNPWWRSESEAWLALHFGIDCVYHADDKTEYEADVFVDDRDKNVRAWLTAWPGRTAVHWRTLHNRSEAVPAGALLTSSWDELVEIARKVARGHAGLACLETLDDIAFAKLQAQVAEGRTVIKAECGACGQALHVSDDGKPLSVSDDGVYVIHNCGAMP
jgi:hypothetical protein